MGDDANSGASSVDVVESSVSLMGKVSDRVFFATDKSSLNQESKDTFK